MYQFFTIGNDPELQGAHIFETQYDSSVYVLPFPLTEEIEGILPRIVPLYSSIFDDRNRNNQYYRAWFRSKNNESDYYNLCVQYSQNLEIQ